VVGFYSGGRCRAQRYPPGGAGSYDELRREVVLGDSHEYGDDITPFDKREIDELMLRELRKMIDLPDWTLQERWHGIYPKAPGLIQFECQPEPNVEVVIASGGCGMTMSFGFANRLWNRWDTAEGPVRTATSGRIESPA
jgi:hypothetical protein